MPQEEGVSSKSSPTGTKFTEKLVKTFGGMVHDAAVGVGDAACMRRGVL